jgi:hypothetical protein
MKQYYHSPNNKEFILFGIKEGLEELKPTLNLHMHDSMFYKINENALIKQDSSLATPIRRVNVVNDLEMDNLDLFDI